jgi:hypothetical protein
MNHGKGTRLCRCGKILPGESSSTRQWLFICEPFASSAQARIPTGTTSGETRGLKIVGGQVQLRICQCIVQSVPRMEVVLHRREGRSLMGGGSSITFKCRSTCSGVHHWISSEKLKPSRQMPTNSGPRIMG